MRASCLFLEVDHLPSMLVFQPHALTKRPGRWAFVMMGKVSADSSVEMEGKSFISIELCMSLMNKSQFWELELFNLAVFDLIDLISAKFSTS